MLSCAEWLMLFFTSANVWSDSVTMSVSTGSSHEEWMWCHETWPPVLAKQQLHSLSKIRWVIFWKRALVWRDVVDNVLWLSSRVSGLLTWKFDLHLLCATERCALVHYVRPIGMRCERNHAGLVTTRPWLGRKRSRAVSQPGKRKTASLACTFKQIAVQRVYFKTPELHCYKWNPLQAHCLNLFSQKSKCNYRRSIKGT